MTKEDCLHALRHSKLARELSEDQCRVLSEHVTLRDLSPGEILIHEGQPDNHLYAIVKGSIGVVKHAGTSDALTLHSLGAGDFVDELGFIDGTEPYASKLALGEARVLGLEREKLESLLETKPHIVYNVMRAIIRAVHQTQRRLAMHSAELANYIYKQHGRY